MVKGAVSKEVWEALSVEGRVLQCIYLSSKMSYYLHVDIHISCLRHLWRSYGYYGCSSKFALSACAEST